MKLLMGIFVLIFSLSAFAGEKVNKTLNVDADGVVDIEVVRGEVTIEAWKRSEIKVEGELDDALETFIFETEGSETKIYVQIDEHNSRWGRTQGTKLTIYLPEKSFLQVSGVSTNFNISGVQGGADVDVVSGDLKVDKVAKEISLETVSGDVEIENGQGDLSVATVSGDIVVHTESKEIEIASVSGEIDVRSGKTKELDVETVSGDISVSCELLAGGKVEMETVSGDINLVLAGEINARFDLQTGPGGKIEDKLTGGEVESSFIGSASMKAKVGKTGKESASVNMNTMSGTLSISK